MVHDPMGALWDMDKNVDIHRGPGRDPGAQGHGADQRIAFDPLRMIENSFNDSKCSFHVNLNRSATDRVRQKRTAS